MYTPKSLPKLPRSACPYRVMIVTRDLVKTTACKNAPDARTGFCKDHSHVYTILSLLEEIHFPALRLNEHLLIPVGKSVWEEYLLTVPRPGEYGVMFSPEQIARWNAEHRPTRYEQIRKAIEDHRSLYPSQRAA